jgi:uncharacterized protein
MTALHLLAYICAALLFQVAVGAGVGIWRWRALAARTPRIDASKLKVADPGAWPGWREFRVIRRAFEDAARSQCSFLLQPVDGAPLPAFKPGQYLTFSLQVGEKAGDAAGLGRSLTRCYSLSDLPDPANYRITVKRMPPPPDRPDLQPGASSSHFHDRVQEGDVLQVKAPAGRFFIDPDATVPAVFIAGGIGITPMMSMLRWCVKEQPGRALHLYYGVRNSADHAFKTLLEDLSGSHPPFHLHVVYSSPGPDDVQGRDYQHAGYIDLQLLRSSLLHGRHQFYICGPPPMMQSLVPALREWGVKEEDIHFEAFGPASVRPVVPASSEPLDTPPVSFDIRFTGAGRTLVWDGQDANLLDFAERHGVAVDSGCRSGSCGSCETKLASGMVQYAEKPDYDVSAGYCLLCVGKPQSALELGA